MINQLKDRVFEVIRGSKKDVSNSLRHELIDTFSVAVAFVSVLCFPTIWLRSEYFLADVTHMGYSALLTIYIGLAIFRRHFSYCIKAVFICLLPAAIAMSGFLHYGLSSLGFFAVLLCALLVMTMFGVRWAIVCLLLLALLMAVIAYFTVTGGASYDVNMNAFNQSPIIWGTHIWVFFLLSLVALVCIGWLQYAFGLSIDDLLKNKIELKKATQELKEMSFTDYLTGLPNRRYFYEFSEDVLALHKRYGGACSVVFIDLDFFKKVNDQYGHDGGDLVLKEFSGFVKERIRESDLFARLGGEEFILLMPHADSSGAFVFVERLREALSKHIIQVVKDATIHVSFSAGIASLRESDTSMDDIINRADLAVYEAKNSGRNCSVIHNDAPVH